MSSTPITPPQQAGAVDPYADAGPESAEARSSRRKAVIGAGIGNALEWYDWHVYGIFTPFFAKQFFDAKNELSALLSTLVVFAVGFAMRPVGGFLFGWIADRWGRRPSMVASIGCAAAGSLAIGLSPTYASIGVGASALLVLARLVQGLAHGGELPSAMTYLAESAPPQHRGRWASAVFASGACGTVVATALGAVLAGTLGKSALSAWGWRIPFIVGGFVALYALFLRRRLAESSTFQAADERTAHRESVWRGVWRNRVAAARVIGLTLGAAVIYQTWTVTVPAAAISVQKLDETTVLVVEVIALLLFIAFLPLCGSLSDRFGRRPVMLTFGLGMAVLSYPLNALATAGTIWQFGVAMVIALFFIAMCVSILPAIFAEWFPTEVRATGTGFAYAVAVALSGGTAPSLLIWLKSQGHASWFTGYSIALALIGAVVIFFGRETRGSDLT